jgi:hypothetical protein
MSEDVVNKQQMEARILLERLETQRAALTLAIEINERYQSEPENYFSSWQEFKDYLEALHEARDECDRFIKALKNPYE